MILPIKLYTTEESYLIFKITIPVWFSFRPGFKPNKIVSDRFIAPKITVMTGEVKTCLHCYCVGAYFRIRSNKTMEKMEDNTIRFILSSSNGWAQFFTSAII